MKRAFLSLLMGVVLCAGLYGCKKTEDPNAGGEEIVKVESVELSSAKLSLFIGGSERLFVTINPENAASPMLVWASDNEDVATVDQEGLVTAVAQGTAEISVSVKGSNDIYDACIVSVIPENYGTEREFTLATIPDDGTLIEVDKWIITDSGADATFEDFNNLRYALYTAGAARSITVEFPELTAFPEYAFYFNSAGQQDDAMLFPLEGLKVLSAPKVTTVAHDAFRNLPYLYSIDMPNVESIAERGFYYADGIIEASFPKLTSVGEMAFAYCLAMKSIEIPAVDDLANKVFYYCGALESISLPLITEVKDETFYWCAALTTVDLPNITAIGNNAFRYCKVLPKADFPKVTKIGHEAFYSNEGMTEINFPEVTEVGESSFNSCKGLVNIEFPKLQIIAKNSFRNCILLESASFPEATEVGFEALSWDDKLSSVNMPKVERFGEGAFYACVSLESVDFPAATDLSNRTFSFCSALTSATLPKVVTVGAQAFDSCSKLATLSIATDSQVTSIDAKAFPYVELANVDLITGAGNGTHADGLKWLAPAADGKDFAFGPFKSITGADAVVVGPTYTLATIPADGTEVEGNTWTITDASAATAEDFANLNAAVASAGRSISLVFPELASFPDKAMYLSYGDSNLVKVEAAKATKVGANAFNNTDLLTASFPEATEIGEAAFNYCSELKTIELPKVQTVGNFAFQNSAALTTLQLPEATKLGGNFASYCVSLTELNIPKATSVGMWAIYGSTALESLIVATESTELGVVANTFKLAAGLENVTLTTGANNGSTVDTETLIWCANSCDFGPFKAIIVK